MANANSIRSRKSNSDTKSVRKKRAGPSAPPEVNDVLNRFDTVLERFSHARSFLECGVRLLEAGLEDPSCGLGDETVCLRYGLDEFTAAYRALDQGIVATQRAKAEREEAPQ
jgi:hypothetical protein